EASDKQIDALKPKDAAGLKEFRRVVGTALRVMVRDTLPGPDAVETREVQPREAKKGDLKFLVLSRAGRGEDVAAALSVPPDHDGTVVVVVHPDGAYSQGGSDRINRLARQALEKKAAVLAVDTFRTGSVFRDAKPPAVDPRFAGY